MRRCVNRRAAVALVLILALTGYIQTAAADALLFESYVGSRPADADRIAVLVHAAFARRGFIVDLPTLTRLLQQHAHRPGVMTPRFEELLRNESRVGESDFTGGRFKKAADRLGKLIAAMRQNSLVLARDPKNRDLALRTMVFYTLACGRLAKAKDVTPADAERYQELRDAMAVEVIRSFPSKVITAKTFGEEAEELFAQARNDLNATGRGTLLVSISDLDGVIYINEMVVGTAKAQVGDLLPGIYRVLIVLSNGESNEYDVEVTAKQVTRLTIDWDIDSLIVVGDWVGLQYRSEKEHARESQLVHDLGQSRSSDDIAATVTITHLHGRPAVIGTSYEVSTGKLLQSGRVELNGTITDERTLDHLIDYIRGHGAAEGVTPVEHPEYTPPPEPEPPPEIEPPHAAPQPPPAVIPAASKRPEPGDTSPRTWPKWAASGGAAVTIAFGSYSVYKNYYPCGLSVAFKDCKYEYRYAGPEGYASLGVGVALSAVATYWFLHDPKASPPGWPAKALIIGGATAIALGVGLYAIDQNPGNTDSRGYQTPTYRDTGPAGVTVGVVGVASVGVGVWWSYANQSPTAPTISVGKSQATFGWAGSF